MGNKSEKRGRIDAAIWAIVADGCFCLAFIFHLLNSPSSSLTMADCLGMAIILCVLLTACWAIYYDHWLVHGEPRSSVKTLRIQELNEGAAIEFDGKRYRVDNINRSSGEILINRVGRPGSIIVQIEGQS